MTLDEFIQKKQEQLTKFQELWLQKQKEHGTKAFPDALLNLPEWDEQLCTVIDLDFELD